MEDTEAMSARRERRFSRADLLAIIFLFVAMLRIAATLTQLAATTDEPVHVSAGVELLEQGKYTLQVENPPMPRVILAFPLWARGLDFDPMKHINTYLGRLFYSGGHYKTNLFLGRIGNLFFFVIAALATWMWARRELGPRGGAVTMFLFTSQPLILGFAGIANHDMAATAGVALSLYAFVLWHDRPSWKSAVFLGVAYGLSIAWKFSDLAFVPVACLAIYAMRFAFRDDKRSALARAFAAVPIVVVAAAITIWGTYSFAFGSLDDYEIEQGPGAKLASERFGRSTAMPAPHLIAGILGITDFEQQGLESYAIGRWSTEGFWWYFPLGLAVKTTLGSLLLALIGVFIGWRTASRKLIYLSALAASLAILLTAMPSSIDLGVRYVLPLYAPLSLAAAACAIELYERGRRAWRVLVIVLVGWHTVASVASHPDYFPYSNEIAARDPSYFLIDSNLDWGQDALRLKYIATLEQFDHIGLALVGMHDYDAMGFPPSYGLDPMTPAQGWVAVSDHLYHRERRNGGWAWLQGKPYRRVGTSIRLYNIR